MANGVARFAAGLLAGGAAGYNQKKAQEQQDAELAMRQAESTQRLAEGDLRLGALRRSESDNIALRDAAAPATLSQSGALPDGLQYASNEDADAAAAGTPNAPMPEVPQYRLAQGANVQRFDTPEAAQTALSAANAPGAAAQRTAAALTAQGKATEGMSLLSTADDYATKHWNNRIRDALVRGHEGLADVMSQSEHGIFKGKKVKAVVDGANVNYAIENPDGSTTPTGYVFSNDQAGIINAGYKLANIDPAVRYKDMVDHDRKAVENDRKERELQLRQDMLEKVQIPVAEARAMALEAKAGRGDGSTAKADSEDRKRWTTLHGEAGRRMDDANKTLRALTTGANSTVYMMNARKNPNGPEAQELASVREEVARYKQDRELYSGLLGGTKGAEARAAAAPTTPTPGAAGAARDPATPPDLSRVTGAPAGAKVGTRSRKGWEVLDSNGKIVGYVQ